MVHGCIQGDHTDIGFIQNLNAPFGHLQVLTIKLK